MTEDNEAKFFFYVCEHGSSNDPCACHIFVDRNAKSVPDDWYLTYTPDGDGGMTDEVII